MADPLEVIDMVIEMLAEVADDYDTDGRGNKANGCRQTRLLLKGISPEITAALRLADNVSGEGLAQVGWTWRTPDGIDRLHPLTDTIPIDPAGALLKVYVREAELDG